MVYYWKKNIHQESKKQLKKVHNTEQLVPRITESKDIHVVGRWLRICTHISYDYLSHAASKIKNSSRKNMKDFSLHLEPSPLVKFSTITVMCMRWQSWKVMPCPHKPATRNSEKIIDKNRACPHKPATRNSEKIIDKNRARIVGYWITGLLLY